MIFKKLDSEVVQRTYDSHKKWILRGKNRRKSKVALYKFPTKIETLSFHRNHYLSEKIIFLWYMKKDEKYYKFSKDSYIYNERIPDLDKYILELLDEALYRGFEFLEYSDLIENESRFVVSLRIDPVLERKGFSIYPVDMIEFHTDEVVSTDIHFTEREEHENKHIRKVFIDIGQGYVLPKLSRIQDLISNYVFLPKGFNKYSMFGKEIGSIEDLKRYE